MKKIFLLFALIPFLLQAQEKGIQFQHELSWQQIQAKAKAENKYIFMDCFTTWCGPCRMMSTQIFPMQEVGDAINPNFIAVKVQLDTTAADNDMIKSWYQDGHDIATKYKVQVFPTYLFFDPNGKLVHRAVGSSPPDVFIQKAKNALNPETQYYTLLAKYDAGQKDSGFLHKVALASMDAYDMENGKKAADEYLKTQSDLYTKSNLEFIQNFTSASSDMGFNLMYKNPEKVDAVLGKDVAEGITGNIIMQEEVFAKFPRDKSQNPDWASISVSLKKNYPAQADETLGKSKVIWYQYIKDWDNYKDAVMNYMNKYGSKASPEDLNNYAWTVFQNCNDMTCVATALDWSKQSFKDAANPAFMDTYANLLYKLGRKDEALSWEQKAMEAAAESDKQGYQETIEKMKAGEKNWN